MILSLPAGIQKRFVAEGEGMRLVIIGAGFAGVWAAASAVRLRESLGISAEKLSVTVISPNQDLEIRPRLYEADPGKMRVPLDRFFAPLGVEHAIGRVSSIDADDQVVDIDEPKKSRMGYDRLVLASGSVTRVPRAMEGASLLHTVDTISDAERLETHLKSLPRSKATRGRYTVVIVGAGFTGIEVATEMITRLEAIKAGSGDTGKLSVVLVDAAERSVGSSLGPGPCGPIEEAIRDLQIVVRLGRTVVAVSSESVTLNDGEVIDAQTVVWTAGMRASELTAKLGAKLDNLGRLPVERDLRVVGQTRIFAAGDTAAAEASEGQKVLQSCQHAIPLGKFAGHNAAADLLDLDLLPFKSDTYVTCLDLGRWGSVYTEGWNREVKLVREEGKARKKQITEVRIYPPLDTAREILRQADPALSVRKATAAAG